MRDFIIFILITIIVFLIFQIMSGTFCHCSTIHCPSNNVLKEYIV